MMYKILKMVTKMVAITLIDGFEKLKTGRNGQLGDMQNIMLHTHCRLVTFSLTSG